jgi:23S rRNA C2498 (ribose-2'-O)-methylase RlmM
MVARKSGIHYAHAKYSSELSNKSWKYCDEIVENPSEIEKVMENFIQYGMGDKKSRNSQISQ